MKRSLNTGLYKKTSKCLQMTMLISLMTLFIFSPCAVKKGILSLAATHTEIKPSTEKKETIGISFKQQTLNNSSSSASVSSYRCASTEYITQKDESGAHQLDPFVFILPDFLFSNKPAEEVVTGSGFPDVKPYAAIVPLFLQHRNILI